MGTGVALVTPFHADGSVDFDGLRSLIDHVIDGQLEFLVSLGTTGESAVLSTDEKYAVLEATVAHTAGRVPVVAGFGGNDTRAVAQSIKDYDAATGFSGIDGILSVSPYYNKPTQEGIYRHYRVVEEVSPRPIILYNVPGRTSSNMTAETTLRLANDTQRIVAVKEASGDLVQIAKILRDRPEGFLVLSGDDALTLPQLGIGIDGVISVVANALPQEFSTMVRHGMEGDFAAARPLHYELLETIRLLFAEGNPGGVKALLKQLDVCEEYLRLPNFAVSDSVRNELAKIATRKRSIAAEV